MPGLAPAGDAAPRWQDRALCAGTDPELFFPGRGASSKEAKKVCRGCVVRAECLDYALAADERYGVWGGLSERDRMRLKMTDQGRPAAGRPREEGVTSE